jgi:hypothetical protein
VVTARFDTRIRCFFFFFQNACFCYQCLSQRVLDLVSSIRSSPVDCFGWAVVLHVGGTSMLSFLVQCWPVQCCSVLCRFLRRVDGAKRLSMTSVGEVTAKEGREKFFVHPTGNWTGNPSLMRQGWYQKTIASALGVTTAPYIKSRVNFMINLGKKNLHLHILPFLGRFMDC